MGNIPTIIPKGSPDPTDAPRRQLATVDGEFDLAGYPSPHSDVAALMVLEHQARAMNLITRLGWEARIAAGPAGHSRIREAANTLADYLLFIDEEPLPKPVRGSSAFTARFSARGPRDPSNRSLYELDLQRRLLKYRCSYMIYSQAFDALPAAARSAVYDRLQAVLAGRVTDSPRHAIPPAERRAIAEILRATKSGLPASFTVAD
jgi:hypothetical protein